MVEQGEAVSAWHHDVGEDEVVVRVLLEPCYGFFGAFGQGCGVAAAFQQRRYDTADGLFVIDYQDSFLRHGQTLSREVLRGRLLVLSAVSLVRLVRDLEV